jgi:hypothetical protein
MLITLALITLLLTVGALLAGAGLAGFTLNALISPDPRDLAFARTIAITGRRTAIIGLAMLVGSHQQISGLALAAVLLVAATIVASYLTNAHIPTAATA